MQNKKLTVFMIIGAFILGYAFFRFTASQVGTKTDLAGRVTVNSSAQQGDTVVTEVSKNKSLNLSGKELDRLP
jgi:hypothetical protein